MEKGCFYSSPPTGGKLWRWKYRHGGKEKLMSLGQYPDVPLAEARERHAEARKYGSKHGDIAVETWRSDGGAPVRGRCHGNNLL